MVGQFYTWTSWWRLTSCGSISSSWGWRVFFVRTDNEATWIYVPAERTQHVYADWDVYAFKWCPGGMWKFHGTAGDGEIKGSEGESPTRRSDRTAVDCTNTDSNRKKINKWKKNLWDHVLMRGKMCFSRISSICVSSSKVHPSSLTTAIYLRLTSSFCTSGSCV